MIVEKFSKYLTGIEYPKTKTSWNIAGIIKGQNAFYRFDVRNMLELIDGTPAQLGRTDTKADKMVLEMKEQWIVLDVKEIHNYIKENKKTLLNLDDLIQKLDWTIYLNK